MTNLTSNLLAAWGESGGSEPDPGTLPGLLSLAEIRLEESVGSFLTLASHFELILKKVQESRNNLQEMLRRAEHLNPELMEAGQENLEAFEDLIVLLEDLTALNSDEEADVFWELLGSFEETNENLRAATVRLGEVANAEQDEPTS